MVDSRSVTCKETNARGCSVSQERVEGDQSSTGGRPGESDGSITHGEPSYINGVAISGSWHGSQRS